MIKHESEAIGITANLTMSGNMQLSFYIRNELDPIEIIVSEKLAMSVIEEIVSCLRKAR